MKDPTIVVTAKTPITHHHRRESDAILLTMIGVTHWLDTKIHKEKYL
jgi:hypothetical protein